jgi:hypothetical protein
MIPSVSLLLILGTSLLVTRVAAVALEHTGLSRDAARFQARSAFTGAGFTTAEAEHVVSHPVRRRIIMWLMLVGNVGIVSAMAALLMSAIDLRSEQGVGVVLGVLVGGLALLVLLGTNPWVDRQMCSAIRWALCRWTDLDAEDYSRLLHLSDGYSVSKFSVSEGDWMAGRALHGASLTEEGILVLGVECPGGLFIGAPSAAVEVRAGDEVLIYGQAEPVRVLGTRATGPDGDRAHTRAVEARRERASLERRRAER